eukprot:1146403-Pelagomonas_calceolata.AAC.1
MQATRAACNLRSKQSSTQQIVIYYHHLRDAYRLQEQQPGASSAPRLPRIPTFDEYSKKRHSKKERARSKKEGVQAGSAAKEGAAPGVADKALDAGSGAATAPAPATAGLRAQGACDHGVVVVASAVCSWHFTCWQIIGLPLQVLMTI